MDFIKQLWARKVVQFGAIYLGAAWVLLQVAIALESALELPNWIDQTVIVLLVIGFPVALILAWAQESKAAPLPEGVMPVVSSQGDKKGLARIAVLPFLNMSGDAEKEYFADGMTEDIITGIARNPHMSVTSRTSAFAYKGEAVDVREAGKALGVEYVLEGSVRPMGDRIRITAQLIEAASGDHLWAEKYDEPTEHLFEVQDKVIAAITQALGVQVTRAELAKGKAKPEDLSRWQFVHTHNAFLVSDYGKRLSDFSLAAMADLEKFIAKEPEFAPAHTGLAWYHASMVTNGWTEDAKTDAEMRDKHLARALALAPGDPIVLSYAAGIHMYANRLAEAQQLGEQALALDPNNAENHLHLALTYGLQQRFDDALDQLAQARAGGLMATHAPWLYWYEALVRLVNMDIDEFGALQKQSMEQLPGMKLPGVLQSAAGTVAQMTTPGFKKIEECMRQAVVLMPGYEVPAVLLSASLAMTGRRDEALMYCEKAMDINPDFTPEQLTYLWSMNPDQRGSELMKQAVKTVWAIEA